VAVCSDAWICNERTRLVLLKRDSDESLGNTKGIRMRRIVDISGERAGPDPDGMDRLRDHISE
jgi:hypothetical protein